MSREMVTDGVCCCFCVVVLSMGCEEDRTEMTAMGSEIASCRGDDDSCSRICAALGRRVSMEVEGE